MTFNDILAECPLCKSFFTLENNRYSLNSFEYKCPTCNNILPRQVLNEKIVKVSTINEYKVDICIFTDLKFTEEIRKVLDNV